MYDDLLGPRHKKEINKELDLEIEVGVDKEGNITRTPKPANTGQIPTPAARPDSDVDEDVWEDVEDLLLEDDDDDQCDGNCDGCSNAATEGTDGGG